MIGTGKETEKEEEAEEEEGSKGRAGKQGNRGGERAYQAGGEADRGHAG
jgi:hypothetical protein